MSPARTVFCISLSLHVSFCTLPTLPAAAFTSSFFSFNLQLLSPPSTDTFVTVAATSAAVLIVLAFSFTPLLRLHSHHGRQVWILHTICFPVLSFYQAPAVIINDPGHLWLPVPVSPGWCFLQPVGSAAGFRGSCELSDGGVRSVQTHWKLNPKQKKHTHTRNTKMYGNRLTIGSESYWIILFHKILLNFHCKLGSF